MWAGMRMSRKRALYTVCFFALCLVDQRVKTASGLDGWLQTFRDLTGVVMGILILSHYQWKDFQRHWLFCLIWGLCCAVGGTVFAVKGQAYGPFLNDRIALAVGVFLLGAALWMTVLETIVRVKPPSLNWKYAGVWLLMMLCMIFSRSGHWWPLAYLVMFGCFYLTDYTKQEREDLFQGMLNGVILGFFLMQGWCFVFRPYDAVRYVGAYNNSNMNTLFYLETLAAVLAKLIYVYRAACGRWVKIYYWLGTGTALAFLFLTIGRTGWMTAAVLVAVALLCLRARDFVKNGLIVILCFVLTFPAVFCAVRYLPPVFHHPVWFWGEWNEDKVHSWDPWDSEKFVDPARLLRAVSNRLEPVARELFGQKAGDGEESAQAVSSEENAPEITPLQQRLYDEAYAAGYALDPADRKNPVLFRAAIYRYYFHLLNFRGHPESEQGFQIVPDHRIGHAHNIYLQWGVDFGIPAMILFIVLIVWTAAGFWKDFRSSHGEQSAGCLLILLVPSVFGLLEYCWGAGSLAVTLLFVIWRRMVCNETGR